MTRPPIRGISYRRVPISQSDGSQSTAVQRSLSPRPSNSHAANSEPNGNIEEIALVLCDIFDWFIPLDGRELNGIFFFSLHNVTIYNNK